MAKFSDFWHDLKNMVYYERIGKMKKHDEKDSKKESRKDDSSQPHGAHKFSGKNDKIVQAKKDEIKASLAPDNAINRTEADTAALLGENVQRLVRKGNVQKRIDAGWTVVKVENPDYTPDDLVLMEKKNLTKGEERMIVEQEENQAAIAKGEQPPHVDGGSTEANQT